MSYKTNYHLEIEPHQEVSDLEFFDVIKQTIEKRLGYQPLEDSCKWYEHEVDMKEISKKFPETLLILHGAGEEPGDLWVKYFKDGRMQTCKAQITYDKFDPKKLQ